MSELTATESAVSFRRVRYKTLFLGALVAASALPLTLCLIKFQITSAQIYLATLLFSAVTIMNNSHTWITLAYFFDQTWLAKFAERPMTFFAAPAAIVVTTVSAMLFSPVPFAISLILAGLFAATWHHAKQNWGIMSIVGKIRGQNVSALRLPLTQGWLFFAFAWSIPLSYHADIISPDLLYKVSMTLLAAYAIYCGWILKTSGLSFAKDPVTLAYAILLLGYFVPVVVFQGQPYALIVFGFAHSLQYYILVLASLSMRKRRSSDPTKIMFGIAVFATLVVGLTVAGYFVIALITDNAAVMWDSYVIRAAIGLNLAVSLVHFWIDAFIWKMSDKGMREAHGDALVF